MASHAERDASHHEDTSRLEAFSDGVFAIAITLLIIEIGVPNVSEGESLGQALRELWPSYFGFALSFLTIGVAWVNHHGIFRDVERVDHTVISLNLLLLLCISFVPFPTAVPAEYLRDGDYKLEATLAYGATFTITAVAFNALWLYLVRNRHLIDEHVSQARLRSRTRRYLLGPVMYAIGFALAPLSTWASLGVWSALTLLYLLPLAEERSGL